MMSIKTKPASKRIVFIIVTVILLFVLGGFYFLTRYTLVAGALESLQNADTSGGATYGEVLFQTRGCAGCHTLEKAGANGDTGPNLTKLSQRMTEAEIRAAILMPNETIAEACPEGACEANVMPEYGRILNEEQVSALVSYLEE
jgi:mono/diheme cytochrome c family protein